MATAFAQQLRQIAAHSTNELDLKARRNAHAESLLFERDVAIKQDWDTLYQICSEGYEDLCALDPRFRDFDGTLFSPSSKSQDREQMNKAQNEDLDRAIQRCLQMLGARLSLRPGLRALEWLIRRFRVHVHNVGMLLLTVLPYHELPLFQNVLSLISSNRLIDEWKFLRPYHNSSTKLPRHTVTYAATTNDGFFAALNEYTIDACQKHLAESGLLRFWGGVLIEAVTGRLKQARSGRAEVQRQRTEDVLHKVLPIVHDGLSANLSPDFTTTCFALSLILGSTGLLDDGVLDSLSDAVSRSAVYSGISSEHALSVLAILTTQKAETLATRQVLKAVMRLPSLVEAFANVSQQYSTQKFFLAILHTALKTITKKNYEERIKFISRLLREGPQLQSETDVSQWLVVVVSQIQRLKPQDNLETAVRARLIALLQELSEAESHRAAFDQVAKLCAQHQIDLEALLQTTILAPAEPAEAMEIDDIEAPEAGSNVLDVAVAALPAELASDLDFLARKIPAVSRSLIDVLTLCNKNQAALDRFKDLDIWRTAATQQYFAFLLRILFSSAASSIRTDVMSLLLSALRRHDLSNLHSLVPYLTVLLSDRLPAVRRAASAAIVSVHALVTRADGGSVDSKQTAVLPSDEVKMQSSMLAKLLAQVYLPNLEEFAADPDRVSYVLKHAMNGTLDKSLMLPNGEPMELKKAQRQALLELFVHHAVNSQLLRLKIGSINVLAGVVKAGSLRKAEALLPLLRDWASLKSTEAVALADVESLSLASVDTTMASLLNAQEKDTILRVLTFVESAEATIREDLVSAVFDRIVEIWKDLPDEGDQSLALRLFDLSLVSQPIFARSSKATLQAVPLSTETLQALLSHAMTEDIETSGVPPPAKKRRTSSHSGGRPNATTALFRGSLVRLSLGLEVVESSGAEHHPQLLPDLTAVLLHLRKVKDHLQTESPYLLNICLGAILAIVQKLKTARRPTFDWNSIRADLIADCVRTSDSSQVQTQALMLCASLAAIAPDKVIHHIMPVFTFMGQRMMAQNDQHTINVMNQAIDHIFPPLVASLRKQDPTNLLQTTKNVLSGFVASFDHIQIDRRIALFRRLLRQLGAAEFGSVIVAMLANRKATNKDLDYFVEKMFAVFSAEVQLATYTNLLVLTQDVFAVAPLNAATLLEITSTIKPEERTRTALKILNSSSSLVNNKNLKVKAIKAGKLESDEVKSFEQTFQASFLQTLEAIQFLRSHNAVLVTVLDQCLIGILQLVSARQLIQSMLVLFDNSRQIQPSIKAQSLRLLAKKLAEKGQTDPETASAALDYLPKLQAMLSASEPQAVKYAAVECIDRISAKFGRRDPSILVSPATVLSSENGLASADNRLQLLAALTLSSMFAILREAAVPVVPLALEGALKLVEIGEGTPNEQLHNAGYGLLASIVQHISFMVSEEDLSKIIVAAGDAAFSELPEKAADSRKHCFDEISRRVELGTLVQVLNSAWESVIEFETDGMLPTLELLGSAIEHHQKADVVQSAESISTFVLQAFDLRRKIVTTSNADDAMELDDVSEVETKLNEIILKFVYKLNDGVFRPIFETWVDWASSPRDLNMDSDSLTAHKLQRQTTFYRFLAYFFATLKSIVTSYVSYMIKPANEALSHFHKNQPSDSESLTFYASLLSGLSEVFRHDADGFFTAPSHFEPLARNLIAQLNLASTKATRSPVFESVLPTIVAFATAVQDTPSHHLAINHYLAQLRHADSSYVRLASIRTHLALTEDEEVGDEWVNNVVSGTVSVETLTAGETEEGGRAGVGGSGETMIYVNEMLEDDDEEVEREVRRWVRMVRERVGEDVFET